MSYGEKEEGAIAMEWAFDGKILNGERMVLDIILKLASMPFTSLKESNFREIIRSLVSPG